MSIFRPGLFKGKVAIVTGGATGIGKAITQELVTLGCKVVIASRKEDRLNQTVKELCPEGDYVRAKVCNIRKEEQIKHLVTSTLEDLGRIDYLVNNGGGQFPCAAEKISLKGWNAVIETNLTGTFLMCKEVHDQWMCKQGGTIVNIIADMFRGMPLMSHTGAARAGVENLTKSLSVEWAEKGIRINSVAPGSSIYSPTASDNYGSFNVFEMVKPGLPTKRLGTTAEISSAVCFLLSPGASFVNGETLRVDGAASHYSPLLWNIPDHSKLPAYDWTYQPPKPTDSTDKDTRNVKAKL